MSVDLHPVTADLIALRLQAKQSHWNLTGPYFSALHGFFDAASALLDELVDNLAERSVQLGHAAEGALHQAAVRSRLPKAPTGFHDGLVGVRALVGGLDAVIAAAGAGIAAAADHDPVTADLLTVTSAALEKLRWQARSHLV